MDSIDLLESLGRKKKDLEFSEMLGKDESARLRKVERIMQKVRERANRIPDDPAIVAQRKLIERFAGGFDPDKRAEVWIAHNAREFRKLWDSGVRDLEELEGRLPEK